MVLAPLDGDAVVVVTPESSFTVSTPESSFTVVTPASPFTVVSVPMLVVVTR